MLEVTRVTIRPNLPLIGKDLDARATLNGDVTGTMPDLWAGTILRYDFATREFRFAVIGDLANPVPGTIGILAVDSFQVEDLTTNRPAMVYRAGTFIRSTINAVNSGEPPLYPPYGPPLAALPPIVAGDPVDLALAQIGIFLEESWDDPALGESPV